MEKTRQLSTKMMASPSLNPNPSSDLVPDPISREEGELFSSDNDEKETHDVSDPASIRIAIPSANAEPIPQKAGILQENKDAGRLNPRIFSSKSASLLVQTSQPKYEKAFGTSQIQYKTVPPRIGASQDNNNLVISFSDDESTSDSDENIQDRHMKNKGRVGEITSYQKPTNLTTQVFQKSGKAPSKENPRIPKQMTLSRKLAPSLPKHPGVGNRADSVVSTGQGSHSRNLIASRKLGNQERGYEFSVGSRNLKLQDLRQQIAIRENELKLKSAHLSKQSVSSRQFSALKVNRDIVGKHQLKSADAGEANGPTFKRLKVDGPSYAQSNPEEHLLPLKNITAPKELVLETSNKGKVDSVQKTSSTGLTQKRVVRWKTKDTEKVDIAARNLNNKQAGIEITSADQGMGMSVDPCPLSSEILPTHRVTPDALPNRSGGEGLASSSLWSSLGTTATENRNLEIQSLSEMEESIDKDLEDAQEYRRRCEIEERNSLKAYCKAQRALIEANLRCTHLYRQRELYSSRLRSFIMDDSFLFGPSNGHGYLRAQMNSSNNTSENLNLEPSLSNHLQSEHDQFNVLGYASNTQGATYSSSFGHVNGQNIGSEPCSEPDASTSEPLPITGRTMVHGESSPSNGQCISGDEDEQYFPFDGKPSKQNVQGQGDEGHNDSSHRIDGKISSESGDPLLLEATLRSELFARLRMRSKQNSSVSLLNMEATAEHRSRSIIDSEKNQVSSGCVPIPESERTEHSSEEGTDREDRELLEASIHIKRRSHTEDYLEQHISHDDRDNDYQENCYKSSITSNLKSAFQHVKSNTNFGISESRKRFREYDSDIDPNTSADCANEEAETCVTNLAETCRDLFESMPSSYSCAAPIHPNWQLCMYDLRGKCNNDECPWQHIKDHSIKKTSQHKDSDVTDIQAEFMSDGDRSAPAKRPKCQTPTYLVGLDILRENMHMYGSFVAPRVGKCWKKCFSICLAGSTFFRQVLSADDSILQNKDGRVELFRCSTNQSSYFRDRNCRMNELSESPIGDGQSLETALLLFNQEGDKLEGKKKALFVLSRALEVNPTSVVLWIVYLVLLYTKARPSDTDDLYSVSVKHNQASYELWLMYVNSRTKLEDRLAAYNEAISVLTNHSSTSSEENQTHTSSCILDLFLQMIECLCMSRNVERALQTIHSFLPTTKECSNTLLSSMLSCLTISDKCIFWVCCVYLVVYRKLPDAIVQQLECEKDLLLIQWPPPGYLTDQDRCKAFELMDFAVCNLAKEEFLKNEAAHGFSLNHIRFSIAVNGVERSRDLLDQYRKKHPTCLDLVLMSARLENLDFDDLSFHGFENALSQWPSGESGVQCIWNQYAESALQHGKIDFAKELMQRWFSSVWDHKNTVLSSNMDKVYGFLNLSLHKLLQQMNKDSHEAINQALTAATDPKTYRKCITEHALFLLQGENTKLSSTMLDLLNSYVSDLRAFSLSDPLSMKFIENVKKPRLQQLIRNNILCPISNNFVLVNSVLDSWFGSTLLPAKFEKVNDLVDFVECVMEISPSNYPLALSACKIISREWGNTATTTSTTTTTTTTTSLAFWASSVLVSSLSHALPIAAEFTWVESVNVLCKFLGIEMILEGFYSKALSVYPFSVDLWESYYRYVCRNSEGEDVCRSVVESAREKGIELGV